MKLFNNIRKRLEAARPGPWEKETTGEIFSEKEELSLATGYAMKDAEFIAHYLSGPNGLKIRIVKLLNKKL